MYDLFRFEDIEFSPCFSSAVSLNVDESRVVSGFDEVPVLDFDDILRYPDDDDYNEGVGEKRESGIGLGLLFDGVSQTYACSCRGNAENVVVEGGVVRSRDTSGRTEWYRRPYVTGTHSDGYMRPPRGGVPPQLAREITRQRKRKREEDGREAGKRMRTR